MDDKNITVLMNYLDKLCANYQETTKIIRRFSFILLLIYFLCAYNEIFKAQSIKLFDLIAIKPEHTVYVASFILGFVYMAIGAFNIYKKRMSLTIITLYKELGLNEEILIKETEANFLKYPSIIDIISYLSRPCRPEAAEEEKVSATVEYTFSFINLLRILFVYVIPLMILVLLMTKSICEVQTHFLNFLAIMSCYILLPGIGVVAMTSELHSAYYDRIEKQIEDRFSMNPEGRKIQLVTWSIGIFFIALAIIGILSVLFVLFSFWPNSYVSGLRFHNLMFRLPVSVLLITYVTVGLGFVFREIARRFESKKSKA